MTIELPIELDEPVFIIIKDTIVEDVLVDYDIWSIRNGIKLRMRVLNHNDYIIGTYGVDIFKSYEDAENFFT